MFLVSYPLLWSDYLTMMPAAPDLRWASVFVVLNIILPVSLVVIGPFRSAVRTGGAE